MRGLLAVLVALAAAFALPSLAQAAPPANDLFASAEVVSGPSGTVSGTRDEATAEPGEPGAMPQLHSIWYAWTAPAYGTLSFDTANTAWAWVFEGDALDVSAMKINGQRYGFVHVTPGETYRIGLDDWNDGGPTQLSWTFAELPPPPPNDDWANAQPLEGDAGVVQVDTLGATHESCDPYLGNGHSLWFSWVAPADGELTVQAITDLRGTIAGVFAGDALCGLEQRAWSGGDPQVANVVAGERYWLAVDTWTDGGGPTSFRYSFAIVTRPANDNFADAAPLGPSYRGSVSGDGLHATAEAGEWTPYGSHTLWYSWTPAESGTASIDCQLCDRNVFTGDSLGALTTVGYGGGQFEVTAGVTYLIQVTAGGMFALEWLLEPSRPPANDDFANALAIAGESGYVESTNRFATLEPGEPDHGGASQASVWFTWTAPADGTATFYVDSSSWAIHQVYVGDALSSLTRVDYASHDVEAQRLMLAAVAGTTYRIAVDGRAGGTSVFWLGWSLEASSGGGGGGGSEGSPPDARPDSFVTDEDVPLTLSSADLLANDADSDGDAISLSRVTTDKKGHGTVKLVKGGGIVFTPGANFNGTARFLYTIVDSTGLETTAAATVEVLPVNDPPTVTLSVPEGEHGEGTPTTLTAVAEDVDGDALTYDWSTTDGTLEVDGPSATLTVDDGPAFATVQVFVSDAWESASTYQDVSVTNLAPSVEAGAVSGVWGRPVAFAGSATDPSAADTAAGLSPSWSFGGTALAALTATRIYDAPGTYTAAFSATDKDGGTTTRDVAVEIGRRAATLASSGAKTAPFGFASVGAQLGDAVEAATARPADHVVTFGVGGATLTATTGSAGAASAAVGSALMPGAYKVDVRFAGDALYEPASTMGDLTVLNSAGKTTGSVTLGDGTTAVFSATSDGAVVRGSFAYGAFTAKAVTALGISGGAAWLAGTGTDGRPFVASIGDAGEPGAGVDSIRLWIGGELQPAGGVIAGGNVQIHK